MAECVHNNTRNKCVCIILSVCFMFFVATSPDHLTALARRHDRARPAGVNGVSALTEDDVVLDSKLKHGKSSTVGGDRIRLIEAQLREKYFSSDVSKHDNSGTHYPGDTKGNLINKRVPTDNSNDIRQRLLALRQSLENDLGTNHSRSSVDDSSAAPWPSRATKLSDSLLEHSRKSYRLCGDDWTPKRKEQPASGPTLPHLLFTHVINPFLPSDFEQDLVWYSLRKAVSHARDCGIAVQVLVTVLEKDIASIPLDLRPILFPNKRGDNDDSGDDADTLSGTDLVLSGCLLTRTSADIGLKRELPMFEGVLECIRRSALGAYTIYTNMDIILSEKFYEVVRTALWELPVNRLCLSITRKVVQSMKIPSDWNGDRPNKQNDLKSFYNSLMNQSHYKQHPGHDCLVFPTECSHRLSNMGDVFVGTVPFPQPFLHHVNMAYRDVMPKATESVWFFRQDVVATYHIGDIASRRWSKRDGARNKEAAVEARKHLVHILDRPSVHALLKLRTCLLQSDLHNDLKGKENLKTVLPYIG